MPATFALDAHDLRILKILQADSDTPLQTIGETVGLSASACSRRIAAMRSNGVIRKNVAIVDRSLSHRNIVIFVLIRTISHTTRDIEQFRKSILGVTEIVEAHRLTGNYDYFLKMRVSSVENYDNIYKYLVNRADLFRVVSYFSAEIMRDDLVS